MPFWPRSAPTQRSPSLRCCTLHVRGSPTPTVASRQLSSKAKLEETAMRNNRDRPRDMANDIIGLVREGTKKWTRTVKAEERNPSSRSYRMTRMTRERGVSFKEAAWEVMETAYMQASGNGALPAH